MEAGQASLLEGHPEGFPGAFVAGGSVVLRVFIPGNPVAKGRPRVKIIPRKGAKPIPQLYTPTETKKWEEHVGVSARSQLLKCEVEGDADFTLPVRDSRVLAHLRFNVHKPVSYPKSVKHAVKKPDLDNLVKAVLDGLVMGGILEDDNCITDMMVSKRYAHPLEHPEGVEVELTCLKVGS